MNGGHASYRIQTVKIYSVTEELLPVNKKIILLKSGLLRSIPHVINSNNIFPGIRSMLFINSYSKQGNSL